MEAVVIEEVMELLDDEEIMVDEEVEKRLSAGYLLTFEKAVDSKELEEEGKDEEYSVEDGPMSNYGSGRMCARPWGTCRLRVGGGVISAWGEVGEGVGLFC